MNSTDKRVTASLKTVALWLIAGTLALYSVTYLAWKLGLSPQALFSWSDSAYAAIEPVRWYLALGRVCVMGLVWWFWPSLVSRWFPEHLPGYEHKRGIWMALRHKILGMFLFLEGCIHISYLGGVGLWA